MEDKRTAILKATLELVVKNGLHATPMAMVAKKANVGAGTIYRYFRNKEALMNELYSEIKKKLGDALKKDINKEDQVKVSFKKFWVNIFYFFIQNPLEFRFIEQCEYTPFVTDATKKENEKHYSVIFEFMNDGINKGVLREMNSELMLSIVYGMLVSVANIHLNKKLLIENDVMEQAIQACWDAIKIN
ncbi:MAG: TetR/AcrR family transcriptional regulator [Chlorobi bacterium]|nr:TetR/AcrR family transcriptional regulator [Chlorobiota bacterium]